MSMRAPTLAHDHWHRRASSLARLDCELADLLPKTGPRRDLRDLPPEIYTRLMPKLAEYAQSAGQAMTEGHWEMEVESGMAKAIWRFVKTLKPDLEPFGDY